MVELVTILFSFSRSRYFTEAVRLADMFDNFKQEGNNIVTIDEKELFEKWEYFNLLFWKIVDWKGSVLEYDRMKYHSHTDKTRIFYALQHAHAIHICTQVQRIKEMKEMYPICISQCDLVLMFN